MTDPKRTVGNLIIFGGAVFFSGWIGLFTDRLTHKPQPTSLVEYLNSGEIPRLFLPLLVVVALRAFGGDGWRDTGFAPHLRGNGVTYLLLILAYPTVIVAALTIGFVANAVSFSTLHLAFYLKIVGHNLMWLFLVSLISETLWRGYLTNQLLKLRLRSGYIYLLTAGVWWLWWLPFWGIMMIRNDHIAEVNVSGIIMVLATIPMFLCCSVFYTEAFRATKSIWPGVSTNLLMSMVIMREFGQEIASTNLVILGLLPAAPLGAIGFIMNRYEKLAALS